MKQEKIKKEKQKMANNFVIKHVKNQTYKPQNEDTYHDRRIKKGYDLILDDYLFQRGRYNEPKYGRDSLNWHNYLYIKQ